MSLFAQIRHNRMCSTKYYGPIFRNESWTGVGLWKGEKAWQWLTLYHYRKPCGNNHSRIHFENWNSHWSFHIKLLRRCIVLTRHW